MQLKRIEIQGFKSFADRTVIQIEEGITTIVGPNGSGKSNISDAIRWVLGEQSAKTLRGSNMQDIIFSGTSARKSLGLAEVTLVLDNSDHTLNIEFDEVSVTRKIFRSSESEYYINNSACRLKDIQELFMDTGVGRDGYSIVGQGKIDSIISSKSEDRRSIFEEASGIVKYKTRKEEAVRKLDNTNTNLERVNDILTEINANLEPLKEKSAKAKKYLELKDSLRDIDVKLFVDILNNSGADVEKLEDNLNSLNESIVTYEQELANVQQSKENNRVALEEALSDIETKQEEYLKVNSDYDRLCARVENFEDRVKSIQENIEKLNQEIIQNKTSAELLEQEIITRNNKKENMMQNKKKFEDELKIKQEEMQTLTSNMSEQELKIEEYKQKIETYKEEMTVYKTELATNLVKIQNFKDRIIKLNEDNGNGVLDADKLKFEKEDIENSFEAVKVKRQKILNEISELESSKQKLDEYFVKTEEKTKEYKQKIIELTSKLNYMRSLEKESAGYVSSVKAIIDLSKKNSAYAGKVYGTVVSIIETKPEYEKAIEIALGGYVQNIVVDTDKTAKDLISFLKDGLLGRATFLPIESVRLYKEDVPSIVEKQPGFIGQAVNLVSFDKHFEPVVRLALGRTIIVNTIENGIKISKISKNSVKIVTIDGEVIATTGSITGGQALQKSTSLVGRSRKLNEIEKVLVTTQQEFDAYQKSLEEKLKLKNENTTLLTSLHTELENVNPTYYAMEEKLNNIVKQTLRQEDIKQKREEERKDLEGQIVNLNKENKEIATSQATLQLKIDNLQDNVNEYTRFNKEKQDRINVLNEDIIALKISVSSFDESEMSTMEMIQKIEQDIVNFETSTLRKQDLIAGYTDELNNADSQNAKDKEELEVFKEKQETLKQEIEGLKLEKASNLSKQTELENQMLKVVESLDKLKQEKSKLEMQKAKFDTQLDNVKSKMWEDYEITTSKAKELVKSLDYLQEFSKPKLEKRAASLRNEIKALGEVSVSSIDEYKTLSERHDFICTQKQDLEETKTKLDNLISNTTSVMKMQFMKQFALINTNFKQVFTELFGGGRAELKLTDENNVLECGIEIEAEPPGKKLQSISLMSGGEKALTAIAILFAIIKLKAPPFCVLDEIEAALDDVNVARFASYIKKYSDETQFMLITHRKGTMEIASTVYGVTMQEYGVSKLISMKLN